MSSKSENVDMYSVIHAMEYYAAITLLGKSLYADVRISTVQADSVTTFWWKKYMFICSYVVET